MNIFRFLFPISTLQSRRWAILPKYDGWQLFFRLNGAEMWRHLPPPPPPQLDQVAKKPPEIKFEEWNWLILPTPATVWQIFNINLVNLLEPKILTVDLKIRENPLNKLCEVNLFLADFHSLNPMWHRQQALCMRIWKQASFIKLFHSHLFSTELVTRVFSLKPLRVPNKMGWN